MKIAVLRFGFAKVKGCAPIAKPIWNMLPRTLAIRNLFEILAAENNIWMDPFGVALCDEQIYDG